MPDLTAREWAAIVPLIILMVWMGSFAQSFPAFDQRAERSEFWNRRKKLRIERVAVSGPVQTAEVARAAR